MITIKKGKVEINDSELHNFQQQFSKLNIFICPELFSDSLKLLIMEKLESTPYILNVHKKENGSIIGQEHYIPNDTAITNIINFYLNQDPVIDAIKRITNRSEIKSFKGRIYKFESDEFSFDNWHDDRANGSRLLGLSINLSKTPYQGGEFLIRNKIDKHIHSSVKHDKWGSAHFFRIDKKLEHMVTKIEGNSPRVAFAGWFMKDSFFISNK